jgi:hypothetical protein
MATRYVSDAKVRLAPELLGAELASPSRRTAAFAVDALLLWVPSMLVAVLTAFAVLAIREPAAYRALLSLLGGDVHTAAEHRRVNRDLVPLLVRYDMPGTPAEVVAAYERGEVERAAELIRDTDIVIVLNLGEQVVGGGDEHIQVELGRLMPFGVRLAAFYGVAAVYFTWFVSRRRGASPGKRWLGVRVVRLDGGVLSMLESFERFVGYAQVPASLFTALLDLWRDPNRRLPHDRLAGTLVVRVRR